MRPTSLTTATAKAKVRLHGTYLTFHYTKDVNALSTRGNVVAGFCVCCAPITELCVCVFPENTAEVGTIAGFASVVAMALVGAVSSYISYQKKKLCFSIQRKLHCTGGSEGAGPHCYTAIK